MAKDDKEKFNAKTFTISIQDAVEVNKMLLTLQSNNKFTLDVNWELDDQIEGLKKPVDRHEEYNKKYMAQYGIEQDKIQTQFWKAIKEPTEDEKQEYRDAGKDKKPNIDLEWWSMEVKERMESYMDAMKELEDKTESITIKPIKYSVLLEQQAKIGFSMTKLRNHFIIKD